MGHRIRTALSITCVAIAASAAFATPAAATPTARTATTTTTTTTEAYCEVTVTLFAQWSTGYSAGVTVQNISTVPVRWQLALTFPGPVWGMQVWGATYQQQGSVVTIIPIPANSVLQPGQSVVAGIFYASGSFSTPPQPDVTCVPA